MRGGGALVAGAVVGALMLAATGCSSGSDAAETTVAPTAVATDPPATEPPDTATDPTVASTTAAPTTAAPTTTLDDEAATLAAVEQAYFDGREAYLAAIRNPAAPDLRTAIEATYSGPNLDFTLARLDSFVDNGWVALPNSRIPSRAVILRPAGFLPGTMSIAELEACEVDGERIVEVGAAPDGSDALITDQVLVEHVLVRLELTDGDWRSQSGEVLGVLEDPAECITP